MQWTYLSKNGTDEYVNRLAQSAGINPVNPEHWTYDQDQNGIVLRGIMKHKIIKQCWDDRRRFRYIDTGYFGNRAGVGNPHGWKVWHRIVDNNLQHSQLIDRPADRWEQFKLKTRPWRRTGRNILLVAPDEKPCKFYNTDVDQWVAQTLDIIKQHTDRPVIVRHRQKNIVKLNRGSNGSFESALDDAYAVVTFNSNAGTESIMLGIPVFVTAPVHAADPVSEHDLSKIETPYYPDSDLVYKWLCHLAYGQFHNKELENGTALRILTETEQLLGL